MRRILITLVMSGALLVAVPGGALAQHHARHHSRHHHARHHARHHRSRHQSRVRHERFGRNSTDQPSSSSGQAGTVTSFDNGVLTITLNDGSMVSGNVTDQTELECMSATSSPQGDDNGNDNGDQGDDQSGDTSNQSGDDNPSGDGGSGDTSGSGDQGDDNGNDNGDQGDDNGDGNGQMCSSSSLTPGTPVAEANLEISNSGATWNKVELITS